MRNLLHYEKYFFLLLVLLHLLPVLLLEFFVTHDGPSHVYNAYIISRLLHSDPLTTQYFQFNPDLVPNWLGHLMLYFFNFFFDGNISERILLGLYIIGFPFSFRYLLLTLNKDAHWASYLIFPFIYTLLFYLGFFNFCIGIPLLFFSLSFLVRNVHGLSLKKFPWFVLLGLLMYFSHIFVLVAFVMCAGIYLLTEAEMQRRVNQLSMPLHLFFRKTGYLLLSVLPCIILLSVFVATKTEPGETFSALSLSEHFIFLFTARPLVTFRFEDEQVYSTVIASAFWFLLFYVIVKRLRRFEFNINDCWLISSVVILLAYFFVPDALASGSFVSHRLLLIFYFFSIIWTGTNSVSQGMKIFSVPVFSVLSLFFLVYHYRESESLNREVQEYFTTVNVIDEGSVVLPISYSNNWLHSNLSDYLSTKKNIVILDNYEAAKTHFPTMWKEKMNPYTAMNFSSTSGPCLKINGFEKVTGEKIDYVIRWAYYLAVHDSCTDAMSNYINERYTHIFTSLNGRAEVFKRIR